MAEQMTPVSKDSPLWRAWIAYRASEQYQNDVRYILKQPEKYVEGQLWSAFYAGFNAAGTYEPPVAPVEG